MKISSISDLHIKSPADQAYGFLMDFLNHEEIKNSDMVFLLGDIFDFMMGEHKEYINLYKEFFNTLESLVQDGKIIHFFEGNHDFHLERLFSDYLKSKNFFYHRKGFQTTIGDKKVYFCHGDDIQIGDRGYQVLKFILRNPLSKFLFNYAFPFRTQQAVAEYFSNKSRKRGQSYFSNQEEIKKIFRKSANKFWETNSSEILVCGHSHCLDDFRPIPNRQYLNNGFPTNSGYFLIIDEGIPSFCKFNFNV